MDGPRAAVQRAAASDALSVHAVAGGGGGGAWQQRAGGYRHGRVAT